MKNNSVELKSIGSLLNGKNYFYIPSYQRGYRWKGKQIEDLLGDLLSFKLAPKGNFYCLQPVIVRPIGVNDPIRKKVLADKADNPELMVWELVDGQQRLTTIYILLNLLLKLTGDDLKKDHNRELFSIYYESKPNFLNNIEEKEDEEFNVAVNGITNIDEAHVQSACYVITKWFEAGGKGNKLSIKYEDSGEGDGLTPKKLRDAILNLIVATSSKEVLKVIWYQLNDSYSKPVEEFIKINNGKIPLLDSELVKALFMQRRDNGNIDNSISAQRGFQWEEMENRLNSNDFWSFISTSEDDVEDRMGLLLKLVYYSDPEIKLDQPLEDGDIFRYFYNKIDGNESNREKELEILWEKILDAFHALEDWFISPDIYNYIGFLVNSGGSVYKIYKAYRKILEDDNPTPDSKSFKDVLSEMVKEELKKVPVKTVIDENGKILNHEIDLVYSSKNVPLLRKIFLFLNIHLLTSQYESIQNNLDKFHNEISIFRFPFDLYKEQGWDIEHIDSQTTNPLTSIDDQSDWIKGAIFDLYPGLTEIQKQQFIDNLSKIQKGEKADWNSFEKVIDAGIIKEINNRHFSNVIKLVEDIQDTDRNITNQIGNLTLLDSATNRSYKNALFCSKRKEIIKAVSKGRYVLPATQYVFMKFFDDETLSPQNRTKWVGQDVKKHHDFIYESLKLFLPDGK